MNKCAQIQGRRNEFEMGVVTHLHFKRIQSSTLAYLLFPIFAELRAYFTLISMH